MSKVTNFESTFKGAAAFNSDLSAWDVSNVMYMAHMFDNAVLFNTDISKWVLPEVLAMSYLFHGATSFNIDVSKWLTSTSKVTSLAGVFKTATAFNQPLTNWETSKITDLYETFYKANSFNGGKFLFIFFRQLIFLVHFNFFTISFFFSPKQMFQHGPHQRSPNLKKCLKRLLHSIRTSLNGI